MSSACHNNYFRTKFQMNNTIYIINLNSESIMRNENKQSGGNELRFHFCSVLIFRLKKKLALITPQGTMAAVKTRIGHNYRFYYYICPLLWFTWWFSRRSRVPFIAFSGVFNLTSFSLPRKFKRNVD